MAEPDTGPPGTHLFVRKRPLRGGEEEMVVRRGQWAVIDDPAKKPKRRTRIKLHPATTWWESATTNEDVWDAFEGEVLRCRDGEGPGALWLAYGQTGSGKTHTLTGTGSDEGLLQRASQQPPRRAAQLPLLRLRRGCCGRC